MNQKIVSLNEVERHFEKEKIENNAESKQSIFGDHIWVSSQGQNCYKLETMTITLFRAANDSGGYKAYLTFSAFATSMGWSTNHRRGGDGGIYLYCKLLNDQGGVLLQWDIPPVDIACGARSVPIFFQKENVNPDIYPLVTRCTFGQAKPNGGYRC